MGARTEVVRNGNNQIVEVRNYYEKKVSRDELLESVAKTTEVLNEYPDARVVTKIDILVAMSLLPFAGGLAEEEEVTSFADTRNKHGNGETHIICETFGIANAMMMLLRKRTGMPVYVHRTEADYQKHLKNTEEKKNQSSNQNADVATD